MWIDQPSPYSATLADGLRLRTPASPADVERIAVFNGGIHGAEVAPFTRNLLLHHPHMQPPDQVFVENEAGEVISALCLIPWSWELDGVKLSVGEMGVVGTSEAYRGRGLVREQVRYFNQRLQARGCVLACIEGIPFFYRQFGYQYVLPLDGGFRWELRHIPLPATSTYRVRAALFDDLPALMALYAQAVARQTLHTDRSEAVWRYLLANDDPIDATMHETWLVEDENGEIAGYARVPRFHFGEELTVDEVSRLRVEPAVALMAYLKALAQERQQPGIRLSLPASCDLVRLALACDAHALGTYAWQIHIPDAAALLTALAPALERRLADSPFAGWSGQVQISFYTSGLALMWEAGALRHVQPLARPAEDAPIKMPRAAFAPLVLGERSVTQLHHEFADLGAHGQWLLLLEVLFPQFESFIYPIY